MNEEVKQLPNTVMLNHNISEYASGTAAQYFVHITVNKYIMIALLMKNNIEIQTTR